MSGRSDAWTRGDPMRALIILLCLLPELALASPVKTDLFGHSIEIKTIPPDDEEALFVDGKQMLENQIINLEENGQIGSTSFAIGSSSGGGNICDASPFVLRFTANAPVQIDGPLDSCNPVAHKIEKDHVTFESPALPTAKGARWIWTANGFGPEQPLTFKPSPNKGWDALRRGAIHHPLDLLGHADLAQQLRKEVSDAHYEAFKRLVSGPGHARYDGGLFIGEACQAHMCDDTAVLIVIDPAAKRIAVAMKDEDKPVLIVPGEGAWPAAAKPVLQSWRQSWSR